MRMVAPEKAPGGIWRKDEEMSEAEERDIKNKDGGSL
jgi:hypothetical protein